MIKLLSQNESNQTRGQNKALSSRYLDILIENEIAATNYYIYSGMTVKSNHLLVMFINSITTPISLPEERYLDLIEPQCQQAARALGIGTATNPADYAKVGTFYGIPELVIGEIKFPDLETLRADPLKVIYHPRTDVTFTLLDGTRNTTEDGLAVVSIDLIGLMLDYRKWQLRENRRNPENPKSSLHFIMSDILPSMITSHNEIAFINRVENTMLGKPLADHIKRTPFYTTPAIAFEKAYREHLIKVNKKAKMNYEDILQLFQVNTYQNLLEWTQMPSVPPTRYGKTMQLLTMLTALEYLAIASSINPLGKSSANNKHDTELEYFLKKYDKENWISDHKLTHRLNKILSDITHQ